jgi:hypothetical protein
MLGTRTNIESHMKLNPPHTIVFAISLLVTAFAIVSHYFMITPHTFGTLEIGYVLLVLACFISGKKT